MIEEKQPDHVALQSTMVGPLWARAAFSQLYPEILDDPQAAEIFAKVRAMYPDADAEFSRLEEFMDEFMGLVFLVRARTFDNAIREFIEKHANAVVVNIGCGLDTTFSRVDNGKITWFNLDLPDAIEFRKLFLPETQRSRCISKSVFEYSWFEEVAFEKEKGIFMFAGGLFNYFKEDEVTDLFRAMLEAFPGGELIFDAPSRFGNWILNRRLRKLGVEGIDFQFNLGNPEKQIPRWSNRLQVIDWFSIFARTPRNPIWKRKTRIQMKLLDWFKTGKFVHVKFTS